MNYPYYRVGGCVRDDLLGVKSKDIDYAVEAPSFDAMREDITSRGGQIFHESPDHFTIRANVPKLGACDYVLCRKDGPYSDGRHPDYVSVGNIFDDLERRDFTMNAIAQSENGELLDPHGGAADIESRVIRAVGNAGKRIAEDKLRAFRAIRFAVTKGFRIDPELVSVIARLEIKDFDAVSTERIYDELTKMFKHDTHFSIMLLTSLAYSPLWTIAMKREIKLLPSMKKA